MKRIYVVPVIVVVALLTMVVWLRHYVGQMIESQSITSVGASSDVSQASPSAVKSTDFQKTLDSIVDQYSSLSVSVSVADITNGTTYDAGVTTKPFKGASTIKVLTATYYLHMVEQSDVSLSQNINGSTAQDLIQAMLQHSDNTAWYALIDFVGDENMIQYAHSIGLASFVGGDYKTITTSDYLKLLTQLESGKLINDEHRALMYSYMQHTDNELLMPAVMPQGITLYHKWGTVWGNLHDVGIMRSGDRSYAVVIYTNNPDGTTSVNGQQTETIQKLTRTITDFIQQQST